MCWVLRGRLLPDSFVRPSFKLQLVDIIAPLVYRMTLLVHDVEAFASNRSDASAIRTCSSRILISVLL